MLITRERWQAWATEAARMQVRDRQRADGALSDFLLTGKRIFDEYRLADRASTTLLREHRTAAVRHQKTVTQLTLTAYLLLLGITAVLAVRRRRRLDHDVVQPFETLLGTIGSIQGGDLTARSARTGVGELDRIGSALDVLAEGLEEAGREAAARERRLAYLADRFETVVRVGREIAGSLSIRYVSAAVGEAAADLLGKPVTLWARMDTGQFEATFRSVDPHGAVPPPDLVPADIVAAAAADARTVVREESRAYALVLAGIVVGVLEAQASEVPEETEQVLDALLSTAAAALESSRLHSAARELAHIDGLTRLPNRRRFETDMDTEWERCRRYGRPMALVMLDLDHFKKLNDEYGHLTGDQALRGVADAINHVLRTSDTGYRYGGEELALLLRETSMREAIAVAERVRQAVEGVRVDDSAVRVTASLGVAERRAGMLSAEELVSAADAALYTAKHAGRNRVVADTDPQGAPLRVIGDGTDR
jgi:diguanylate cyclase (GGDEF)-like protein